MLEATLAFLGLGDISSMSWGMMLSIANERSAFLTDAWLWWVVPPGALIGLTVLGFALAGGAVERTAGGPRDPRLPPLRQRARRLTRPCPARLQPAPPRTRPRSSSWTDSPSATGTARPPPAAAPASTWRCRAAEFSGWSGNRDPASRP